MNRTQSGAIEVVFAKRIGLDGDKWYMDDEISWTTALDNNPYIAAPATPTSSSRRHKSTSKKLFTPTSPYRSPPSRSKVWKEPSSSVGSAWTSLLSIAGDEAGIKDLIKDVIKEKRIDLHDWQESDSCWKILSKHYRSLPKRKYVRAWLIGLHNLLRSENVQITNYKIADYLEIDVRTVVKAAMVPHPVRKSSIESGYDLSFFA